MTCTFNDDHTPFLCACFSNTTLCKYVTHSVAWQPVWFPPSHWRLFTFEPRCRLCRYQLAASSDIFWIVYKHQQIKPKSSMPVVSQFGVVVDALAFLSVGIIDVVLFTSVQPFKRGFFCDDESIKYPRLGKETVSDTVLVLIALLPAVMVSWFGSLLDCNVLLLHESCQPT